MELLSLLFFFLIILSLSFKFLFTKKSPQVVGFRKYPFLGTLPDFLKHRSHFLDWSTQILRRTPTNTAVFYRPGKLRGIITANPNNVEHILKSNFPNYPKGQRFISLLQDFLGTGIFNSDGHLWKLQRKTASHEFNTKSLRNFLIHNVSFEIQARLGPLLAWASETGRAVDLQDVLERFAFDNICKLAFNYDPECLNGDGDGVSEFMTAFEDAATLSAGRFMYALPGFFKIKRWMNVGSERRLREAIVTVHKFADDIIRSRLDGRDNNHDLDLLSRFIGTDEDNCDNSPEFLRDIVISFILAGRDTTSSALTWFFWILSSRRDVKEEIRDEIREIRLRNGKMRGETFGYNEVKEMNYLQAVISESMRLYPPVPVDTKLCLNDDVLPDGTVIGKDWFISYHTYAMGRMESVWGEDCCEFKPERWIDENGVYKGENPFRYPVFHAGPRLCLGKELAYIQMKCIAASVLELFEVEALNKDTCPQHVLSLTLRMKGGLPVVVSKRDTHAL